MNLEESEGCGDESEDDSECDAIDEEMEETTESLVQIFSDFQEEAEDTPEAPPTFQSISKQKELAEEPVLYKRVLNRYLNVVQKSFKKRLVSLLEKKKVKALREKLSGNNKQARESTAPSVLDIADVFNDASAGKERSHVIIKFHAFRGRTL